MNKYSEGRIYKLTSKQSEKFYIGSTIKTLHDRFKSHKTDYKNYLCDKKYYMTSFEILKYDDCVIELIQTFPCDNEKQLRQKEGELQLQLINVIVNKNIAGHKGRRVKQQLIAAYKNDIDDKPKNEIDEFYTF